MYSINYDEFCKQLHDAVFFYGASSDKATRQRAIEMLIRTAIQLEEFDGRFCQYRGNGVRG